MIDEKRCINATFTVFVHGKVWLLEDLTWIICEMVVGSMTMGNLRISKREMETKAFLASSTLSGEANRYAVNEASATWEERTVTRGIDEV